MRKALGLAVLLMTSYCEITQPCPYDGETATFTGRTKMTSGGGTVGEYAHNTRSGKHTF